MPKGYFLMESGHHWYILRDDGTAFMKKLLDSDGAEKLFHSPKQATDYAYKHAELKLNYDQEVPNA